MAADENWSATVTLNLAADAEDSPAKMVESLDAGIDALPANARSARNRLTRLRDTIANTRP